MRYLALFFVALFFAGAAIAEDYTLTIKDHKFQPAELLVPSGKKVKITVKNEDKTPAEFESSDLDREKLVQGNSQIDIYVGPLNAGKYGFFDDFHEDTTKGTLIVK